MLSNFPLHPILIYKVLFTGVEDLALHPGTLALGFDDFNVTLRNWKRLRRLWISIINGCNRV